MCSIPTDHSDDNAEDRPFSKQQQVRQRDERLVDLCVNHNMRTKDAAKAVGLSLSRAKGILRLHGANRPVGRPKKCSTKDAR